MTPPSKDEIRDYLSEVHASEGIEGEPDEVMVDAVHHALSVMDLSMRAMPDEHRLTCVTLVVLAFTYGQNATAMRLAAWLDLRPMLRALGFADEIRKMHDGKRPFPPMPPKQEHADNDGAR